MKIIKIFAASSSRFGFLVTGVFFLLMGSAFVYSVFHPQRTDASTLGAGHPSLPRSVERPLEITIANNGTVYLKDAVLASVSGNTITANIAWGSATFTWKLQMSPNTRFVGQDGKQINQTDLVVGDYVSILGKLQTNAVKPTIDVQNIQKDSPVS